MCKMAGGSSSNVSDSGESSSKVSDSSKKKSALGKIKEIITQDSLAGVLKKAQEK